MVGYVIYTRCIQGTFQVQYVYGRASHFGRGQQSWAFATLSQQGVRATLEGTDGLNSLSPWFTIQTDSERNKEPEKQSTTEGDLIIETEKKTR